MSRGGLRRRAAIEFGTLACLTALFLALLPRRPLRVDMGLALLAVAAVCLTWRETRERFWGPAADPWAQRMRRSLALMLAPSVAVVLGFGVHAALAVEPRSTEAVFVRLFRPGFLSTLALFVPWALTQQALFQFYLHGRVRALLPARSWLPVVLTGLGYGAVHLPDRELALVTAAAGIV